MRALRKLKRLLGMEKEEEDAVGEPEVEEKIEEEFPGISAAERKKHVGEHAVIAGGKIVASGKTAKKVLEEAEGEYSREEVDLRYVGSEKLLIKCKCLEGDRL